MILLTKSIGSVHCNWEEVLMKRGIGVLLILVSFALVGTGCDKPKQQEVVSNTVKPVESKEESMPKTENGMAKSGTIKANEVQSEKIIYQNGRFGYQIEYPKEWGEPMESENGDGFVLLEDTMYDISVYGSYLIDDSFEEYLQTYYEGWDYVETKILGADISYLLEYTGEDSYQEALVGYKDGTIYTFSAVRMYVDPEYEMDKSERIEQAIGEIQESFSILN